MDADSKITLDDYYARAVADIRAKFPQFATVEFDRDDHKFTKDQLPACLLEISEFDDANDRDPGTEQWATLARIEARIVLGFRTEAVKLECRKAATSLAVWMRKRRFSHPTIEGKKLPTGGAQVVGCYKDDFSPEMDEFEIWRVEWLHEMTLGETVWTPGDPPPGNPQYSWVPKVGEGNAGEYSPVLPPAAGGPQ